MIDYTSSLKSEMTKLQRQKEAVNATETLIAALTRLQEEENAKAQKAHDEAKTPAKK